MRYKQAYTLAAAVAVLLFTAACGSSGLGDILGGGGGTAPQTQTQTLHGTVDQVDTSARSILLRDVRDYGSNLSGGTASTGSSLRVYYDDQTVVDYQGRNFRPQDLERGDEVDVRYTRSGSNLVAQSMTVTYNVATGSGTGSGSYPGSYGSVRGSVQSVDTSRRLLQVTTGGYGSSTTTLQYDNATTVTFNGRSYRPEDLERGDQVDITTRNVSGGVVAQHINVISSATAGGTSAARGTVQGTVSLVDTGRRTIQLTQAVWGAGFAPGTTQTTVTVQYDDRSYVEYQGQSHPVTGLERGDVVNIELLSTGSNPLAGRITLLRDVRR